jgi:hypothetical protein
MFKFYKDDKGPFLISINIPGIPFQEFLQDRNRKHYPKNKYKPNLKT